MNRVDTIETHPLESLSVAEAKAMQFRLVDAAARRLSGTEALSTGDLGVAARHGRPETTEKIEGVVADFFGAEAAALVRGAGSGAVRFAVWAVARAGDGVLTHDAPIYDTTKLLFDSMGLKVGSCDFNSLEKTAETLRNGNFALALAQHARQKIEDRYALADVISVLKRNAPEMPVVTDDNYAALKVPRIGIELGADLSTFSAFKLLGPEGVGCVAGRADLVERIHKMNYSGGGQVQGHEAMEVLRGMICAPVLLALQAEVVEELHARLNAAEIQGVKRAFIANAQSKVLLVELERPFARKVLERAEPLGAAPWPVGAESKYEFAPMFYRVSGTFLASNPWLAERMIRINPMRAGADTVLGILERAIAAASPGRGFA
ncbi:MAG: aminotransferase class V-fold PLP-dependent enzyme [Synergistaceae bacterium]|jgi:hypothetical protein|nr:aminotransferase class V-fold PLP-dependent enzyme [Synergistaceae bacterium]